ncbi:MAG: hypothetical protein ACKVPX_16615 [Myxococcaceae bacterium]
MKIRTVAVGMLILGCANSETREPAPVNRVQSPGKPHGPFQAVASFEGEMPSGASVPWSVTVTPSRDCEMLETRLRGLDGVDVNAQVVSHGACQGGASVTHAAEIRVGPATSGLVVLDVSMRVDGREWNDSRTFAVRAKGVSATPKPVGTIVESPNGERVIVQPSSKR